MFFDSLTPYLKENIKSPIDFPKSYHFFSYLYSHPSPLQIFSCFFVYFMKFQEFLLAFSPYALASLYLHSNHSVLNEIYSSILHFSSFQYLEELYYDKMDIVMFILAAIFLALLIYVSTTYYFFLTYNDRVLQILDRFKMFIFYPIQVIFFYPCVISLALTFSRISDTSTYLIDYLNFFLLILFIIIMVVYTYWVHPVYYGTPFYNDFYSSRASNFAYSGLYVLTFVSFCFAGKYSVFFFPGIATVFQIIQISSLVTTPYMHTVDTAIYYAISIHIIVFSIVSTAAVHNSFLEENILNIFYISIAFFVLVFSIALLLLNNKKIISKMNILSQCQYAISFNSLTSKQVNALLQAFKKNNDIRYLSSYVYFKLMLNDVDKDISHYLVEMTLKNFGWGFSFHIFELYKYFCSISDPFTPIPKIEVLQKSLQEYSEVSDSFWSAMIKGKITKAFSICNLSLEKLHNNLINFYFFHSFFPHNQTIINLEIDYPYLSHVGRKGVNLFNRFQSRGNKIMIADSFALNHGVLSETTTNDQDDAQLKRVKNNIKKFANKPIPIGFILFLLLLFFMIFFSLIYMVVPFQNIKNHVNYLKYLPETVSHIVKIGIDWGRFNSMITMLINCTESTQKSCDQVLSDIGASVPDPPGLQCTSYGDLAQNLTYPAQSINENAQNIHSSLSCVDCPTFYKNLIENLLTPSLYPFSSVKLMDNIPMDAISLILKYSTSVIRSNNISRGVCNNPFLQAIKLTPDQFYSNAFSIFDVLLEGIERAHARVNALEYSTDINIPLSTIALTTLMIPFFIIVITILFFLSFYYISKIMVKHFKPKNHPNQNIHIDYSSANESFTPRLKFYTLPITLLFAYGIYLLQILLIWRNVQHSYNEILYYSNFIVALGNYSFYASKLFSVFVRLEIDPERINSLYDLNQMYLDMRMTHKLINQLFITLSRTSQIKAFAEDYCQLTAYESMHDIVRCWSVLQALGYFTYVSYLHIQNPISYDYLDHFYISHIMPICQNLTNNLVLFTEEQSEVLSFNVFIETAISSFIAILMIAYALFLFLSLVNCYNQLISLYLNLEPIFIAKNKCLMSFLIDIKDNTDDEAISNSLTIFDKSNISLLILSKDLNIIACTRPLLKIFGYRKEQLVGQYVEILIPKSSKQADKNDVKFYQQMNILKKNFSQMTITRWVVGRCSDNSTVHLRAMASLIEYSHKIHFVLEFKPMSDELDYEDLILIHSQLFHDFSKYTMPLSLFSFELNRYPEKKRFKNSVLVYVGYSLIDESISSSDDFEKIKNVHEYSLPYLNGYHGAIVIDCSCSFSLILFVNDKKDDQHIINAIQFILGFSQVNPYETIGLLITIGKTKVVMYPPPLLSPGEEPHKKDISSPTMAIEPLSPVLNNFPKLFKYFKPKSLLITDDLLEYFQGTPTLSVTNDLGMSLSLASIGIEEYPDLYQTTDFL